MNRISTMRVYYNDTYKEHIASIAFIEELVKLFDIEDNLVITITRDELVSIIAEQ